MHGLLVVLLIVVGLQSADAQSHRSDTEHRLGRELASNFSDVLRVNRLHALSRPWDFAKPPTFERQLEWYLNSGARALRLTPSWSPESRLMVRISASEHSQSLHAVVEEAVAWLRRHPTELLVFYVESCDQRCHSHMRLAGSLHNVRVLQDCRLPQLVTVGAAQKLGRLSSGGSLLSFCNCSLDRTGSDHTLYALSRQSAFAKPPMSEQQHLKWYLNSGVRALRLIAGWSPESTLVVRVSGSQHYQSLYAILEEAIAWLRHHSNELVALYVESCDHRCYKDVGLAGALHNITVLQDCRLPQLVTVGAAHELGRLSGGGSLLSFCNCSLDSIGSDHAADVALPDLGSLRHLRRLQSSLSGFTVSVKCKITPEKFDAATPMYVLECPHENHQVQINLEGINIFGDDLQPTTTLSVDLPVSDEAHMLHALACVNPAALVGAATGLGAPTPPGCQKYTFDVFRVGSKEATLVHLAVSSTDAAEVPAVLEPSFDSKVHEYSVRVKKGTPFSISAGAGQTSARVGIAFDGDFSVGGLSLDVSGCRFAARAHDTWDVKGLEATGEFTYHVCAMAADLVHKTVYKVTMKVSPAYSPMLSVITVDGFTVKPVFDPFNSYYQVQVHHTTMQVHVCATAQDAKAEIKFEKGATVEKKGVGQLCKTVHMHDNHNLPPGIPPQWSVTESIAVTSSDGLDTFEYTLLIQQDVSTFSRLKNLTVMDTPCTLEPEFDPEVTEYRCIFHWKKAKTGKLAAQGNIEHCVDCLVMVPDPEKKEDSHLSIFLQQMEPTAWQYDKIWARKFLYGEYHTVRFMVMSQDRFHHTTYNVYLERWSPWYMRAAVTRSFSHTAATISTVMSATSAGAMMALTKQVQFMKLTTEIHGCPKLYADFADSLKGFSLDIGPLIPNPGIPTMDDIKALKEQYVEQAKLLPHYCHVLHKEGPIAAEKVLEEQPEAAAALLGHSIAHYKKKSEGTEAAERWEVIPNLQADLMRLQEHARRLQDEAAMEQNRVKKWGPTGPLTQEMIEEEASIDCSGGAMAQIDAALDTLHKFKVWNKMLHSTTGTLIILTLGITGMISFYSFYYFFVFRHMQARLKALEPGPLWIFLLDFGLIGFASSAAHLLFDDDAEIDLFGYVPSRTAVEAFCACGMVVYPVFFLIFVVAALTYVVHVKGLLVFSDQLGAFADPECHEIKVGILPPVPRFVPIVYQCMHKEVRACIPIRDEDGEKIKFQPPEDPAAEEAEGEGEEAAEAEEDQKDSARIIKMSARGDQLTTGTTPRTKKVDNGPAYTSLGNGTATGADDSNGANGNAPHETNGTNGTNGNHAADEDDAKTPASKTPASRAGDVHHDDEDGGHTLALDAFRAENPNEGGDADDLLMERKQKREETIRHLTKQRTEAFEKLKEQAENKEGAFGPPWLADLINEESPEEMQEALKEWDDGNREGPCLLCESLDAKVNSWESAKNHSDEDRLEVEERFALMQWIENLIRHNANLDRFNILKVVASDGHIKPCEPMIPKEGEETTRLWPEEGEGDANLHRFMQEHGKQRTNIKNDKGERLVFPGKDNSPKCAPGGPEGGFLFWKREPDVGWTAWEEDDSHTEKYADKWQWICFEYPLRPWMSDEGETGWYSSIPFYDDIVAGFRGHFAGRVEPEISEEEKNEIRKWVWAEYQRGVDIKMQIGHFSEMHPTIPFKGRSLDDNLNKDFAELFQEVQVSHDDDDQDLLDFILMKIEDLVAVEDEKDAWWKGCDEPAEGEMKVMMDDKQFWKTGEDLGEEFLHNHPQVPKKGYFSSPCFSRYPKAEFAIKRYRVAKPGGTQADVHMNIQLVHVLPIMRYIPRFKLNVKFESLDMEMTSMWKIVLKDRANGQEFDYVFDRVTTLVSILAVSAGLKGAQQGVVFLSMKCVVMLQQMRSDYYSTVAEMGDQPITATDVIKVYLGGDVFKWTMQAILLANLTLGLVGEYNIILCGLVCILMSAFTMLFMNIMSFGTELQNMVDAVKSKIQGWISQFRLLQYRFNQLLVKLGLKKGGKSKAGIEVDCQAVTMIIPELGLAFQGKPVVDRTLTMAEQAEQEIHKMVMQYEAPEDLNLPYPSIQSTERFENDVKNSFTICLDPDHVRLRKRIPEVAATIQIVNHYGPSTHTHKYCKPQYDSYVTLYKPENWNPEDDEDAEKVQALLTTWRNQIRQFLEKDLGAMETDRTGTAAIIQDLDQRLRQEFGAALGREGFWVKIESMQNVLAQAIEDKIGEGEVKIFICASIDGADVDSSQTHLFRTGAASISYSEKTIEAMEADEETGEEGFLEGLRSASKEAAEGPKIVKVAQVTWEELNEMELFAISKFRFVVFLEESDSQGEKTVTLLGDSKEVYLEEEEKEDRLLRDYSALQHFHFREDDQEKLGHEAMISFHIRRQRQVERDEDKERVEFLDHVITTPGQKSRQSLFARNEKELKDLARVLGIHPWQPTEKEHLAEAVVDGIVVWLEEQASEATNVVHYVALSDHLKPNRLWKPDAIPAHVAELVKRDIEVVREVELAIDPEGPEGTDQELGGIYRYMRAINARHAFFNENAGHSGMWLYFDSHDSWVVSANPGAPRPARLGPTGTGWAFVRDKAPSPNLIMKEWQTWNGQKWAPSNLFITDPEDFGQERMPLSRKPTARRLSLYNELSAGAGGGGDFIEDEESFAGRMSLLWQEVRGMFCAEAAKDMLKELQPCLVGLAASVITIRWKDVHIEALAPFRKFLLEWGGNYDRVWVFLTQSRANDYDILRHGFEGILDDAPGNVKTRDMATEARRLLDICTASGEISWKEIRATVYDNPPASLQAFSDYAKQKFPNPAGFWSKITRKYELDRATFKEAMVPLAKRFMKTDTIKDKGDFAELSTADEVLEKLFDHFDAQGSGGISRQEIPPAAGETMKEHNKSLLEFKIPLEYIKEITTEAHRRRVTLKVNPKFATMKEWEDLRLGMDPDYILSDRENEHVSFVMPKDNGEYFELWKAVVMESKMSSPQEWIQFYDGQVKEHPKMSGTYIRNGFGEQRWSNGRIYHGLWKDHAYDTPQEVDPMADSDDVQDGEVWANERDKEEAIRGAHPIYKGQWRKNMRHGHGVLRWEQESAGPTANRNLRTVLGIGQGQGHGVRKVYEGQFKDDLFHGQGKMTVENAVVQRLPMTKHKGAHSDDDGHAIIPIAQTAPSQMKSFVGEFASNWEETREQIKDKISWPDRELDIMNITRDGGPKDKELVKRFFPEDEHNMQQPGESPHDYCMDVYCQPSGEVAHMVKGKAEYCDHSTYDGPFKDGLPHGVGVLTQYEVQAEGDEPHLIARYEGDLVAGHREGKGEFLQPGGVKYTGDFVNGQKHGNGIQTVPPEKQAVYGYEKYEGEWVQDVRQGKGKVSWNHQSLYEYTGDFKNNLRDGRGKLDMNGKVKYFGMWKHDAVITTKEQRAWCVMDDGELYFGEMTANGNRHNFGLLYAPEAIDDPDCEAAMMEGRELQGDAAKPMHEGGKMTFKGNWKHNVPEGEGSQYMENGFYEGGFSSGKRSGRGTWQAKDGSWKYMPVEEHNIANWENDLMHGVAVVEDKRYIHQNVIFVRGECQMPFSFEGPLASGFKNIGSAVKKAVRKKGKAGDTPDPDWHTGQTGHVEAATGKKMLNVKEHHLCPEEAVEQALVREDTKVVLPDEDVLVSGGTGVNAVLNGHYVRQTDLYGEFIYKQYRTDGNDRYMYNLSRPQPRWIIGTTPFAEPDTAAGWAYADDNAQTPMEIFGDWTVYHPKTRKMVAWTEDNPIKGVDRLKLQVVIGMEVKNISYKPISSGLFVRHATLVHDRPIYYESEHAKQYLYWKAESEEPEVYDEEHKDPKLRGTVKPMHEQPGFWILSTNASSGPKETGCLAFVKDSAPTPNQVSKKAKWMIPEGVGDERQWVAPVQDKNGQPPSMFVDMAVEEDEEDIGAGVGLEGGVLKASKTLAALTG